MRPMTKLGLAIAAIALLMSSGWTASVSLGISGEGAVDETTIKAGQPVSVDIYFENDAPRTGITVGFKVWSDEIEKIIHVADSGNGLNDAGDVKGHADWAGEGKKVWDLFGIFAVLTDWDGVLPDTLGFGALCNQNEYLPHELEKKLSFEIIVPFPGTLVVDSSFYPPGGTWLYSSPPNTIPSHVPEWKGPYEFKVIE